MILKFFINICKQDPKRYPRFLVPNEPEKQTNQHCWTRETEEKNHSVYLLCLKENTTRGVILACPNCQCSDPGDLRLAAGRPGAFAGLHPVQQLQGPMLGLRRTVADGPEQWRLWNGGAKWRIDFWHLPRLRNLLDILVHDLLSSITIYKSSIIICKMDHSPHLC